MQTRWKYIFGFLALICILVWLAVITYPGKTLKLIACDVGQGDAILAQMGHRQLLIDGGPGGKVTECLSRHMPFWDRTVEAVLMTHPEKDHYLGLIKVLKDYKVNYFLSSGLDSDSQEFRVLKDQVGGEGSGVIIVREGYGISIALMHLDILHPSDQFIVENSVEEKYASLYGSNTRESKVLGIFTSKKNKNDFSVVAILTYGSFNALLTGDIEDEVSDIVADELAMSKYRESKRTIEYLKVPHHGSKNGLSRKLLDVVSPRVVAISSGKGNSYGHPHNEVLDILNDKKISILRTDQTGDLVVETDGKEFWIKE